MTVPTRSRARGQMRCVFDVVCGFPPSAISMSAIGLPEIQALMPGNRRFMVSAPILPSFLLPIAARAACATSSRSNRLASSSFLSHSKVHSIQPAIVVGKLPAFFKTFFEAHKNACGKPALGCKDKHALIRLEHQLVFNGPLERLDLFIELFLPCTLLRGRQQASGQGCRMPGYGPRHAATCTAPIAIASVGLARRMVIMRSAPARQRRTHRYCADAG